jgi:hypothetical protein
MAMFGCTDAKMVRTDTRKAAQNKVTASGAAKSLSHFTMAGQKTRGGFDSYQTSDHKKM